MIKKQIFLFALMLLFVAAGCTAKKQKTIDFQAINQIIQNHAKSFPGTLGVAVKDLKSGKMTHYNGNASFQSASIVKLPILVEYAYQIEEGSILPEEKIKLKDSYKVGGAGTLKDKPSGEKYTLETLCVYMITISDNTATDMLIDRLGMKNIEERMKKLGLKNTTLKRTIYDFGSINEGKDNLTTPLDMCRLLTGIYYERIPSPKGSKMILDILKKQKCNHLIPAKLPPGTTVAHKTGQLELLGVLGNVGIIYPAKNANPYILCLLAKNITSTEKAERAFSNISLDIFEKFDNSP